MKGGNLTLLIVPVKDEENIKENIHSLMEFCKFYFVNEFQILVINDGMMHGVSCIKDFVGERLRIVNNMFDSGKGSALKTGHVLSSMIYSLHDNDNIIFLDGDGQIDHREIPVFLDLMKLYRADVVIGNKSHDYSVTDYTPKRKLISRCYNRFVRVLFGLNYKDTQCGLKLFKKYALDKVIKKVTIKRFAFDIELIISLRDNRFRIIDAPVNINKQLNSGSVTFSNIFNVFFDTLGVLIKSKKGFYSKKESI